jgi:hypothetical protein
MNTTQTTKTATLSLLVSSPQNELFGAVRYTITDTLTERDGGIQVDTHSRGICEGDRVDQRGSKFHPGANFDGAVAYRLRSGYVAVRSAVRK